MTTKDEILLEVKNLKKYFPIQKGFFRNVVGHVKAVDGVDLFIREGETLGLVGESGCGKTTTGRLILRALDPTEGEVLFRTDDQLVNIANIPNKEMKDFRRDMAIIFQDPFSSLSPRMTVMDIVGEPLEIHGIAKGNELKSRIRELLEQVGLRAQHMNRYPYAFSGGQRQRIGIARALALQPKLIVCDEPVSALDVSIQAQVLNLLEDLQQEYGLTYLFIAHDLSVVEHISDRVAVMYLGKIVEAAPADELYANPLHPYTEALLSSVPRTDPSHVPNRILLEGDVPSPADPPPGCKFHPRCRYAESICAEEEPELLEIGVGTDHYAACHLVDKLNLAGFDKDDRVQAEAVLASTPVEDTPYVKREPIMAVDTSQDIEELERTVTLVGFGRRFLATLIDGLIVLFLSFILMGFFAILSIFVMSYNPYGDPVGFTTLFFLSSILISMIYYVRFWTISEGQTIGKGTVGIRAIRTDGSSMSVGKALLRYLGYIISGLIFSLGFIWVAFDGKRQGWHDKLAGTYVINEDDAGALAKADEKVFVQSDAGQSWIWIVIWAILALAAPAALWGMLFFLGPVVNNLF